MKAILTCPKTSCNLGDVVEYREDGEEYHMRVIVRDPQILHAIIEGCPPDTTDFITGGVGIWVHHDTNEYVDGRGAENCTLQVLE